jgi:DNA transformation protein and related proteins
MSHDRDFINYLLELLSPLPDVSAKRMFGGYGIFRNGLMFALVADATLYFKVDDQTQVHYDERGLEAFTYSKEGKVMRMSYYRAPEEALDGSDGMCEWAELAYQSAVRVQKPKRKAVGRRANDTEK